MCKLNMKNEILKSRISASLQRDFKQCAGGRNYVFRYFEMKNN